MLIPRFLLFVSVFLVFTITADAQKRRADLRPKSTARQIQKPAPAAAMVIDESLSVLRVKPSLFADSIQRMRRGRRVRILDAKRFDGVVFYRVAAPPNKTGWVQSDAVFGRFRQGDDARLARLIQAADAFEQIELAVSFLELFPHSAFRPAILLLAGDLAEEAAGKLSRDAARRLDKRSMAATGAPLHSFYLNFVSLDRYRKLGIVFLFDTRRLVFRYDGASWQEIVGKHPNSAEAVEARERIESLKRDFEGPK